MPHNRPNLPASAERLRIYLRDRLTNEHIRDIASANYGQNIEEHMTGLTIGLQTGAYYLPRSGNLYECAILQEHFEGESRPIQLLCSCWWLGWFCTGNENQWVLIDNRGGVPELAKLMVEACTWLDREAASASASFLAWLATVDSRPDPDLYNRADIALGMIEKLGIASSRSKIVTDFLGRHLHD